jgi:hypothetical protein
VGISLVKLSNLEASVVLVASLLKFDATFVSLLDAAVAFVRRLVKPVAFVTSLAFPDGRLMPLFLAHVAGVMFCNTLLVRLL